MKINLGVKYLFKNGVKLRVDFMKDKESVKSGIKLKQNIKDGAKQSIYMFEKSGKEKYDFYFRIV
jgi:hypothetical protein